MTVYNGEKTVERAVKSIINQTLQPAQVIIVNDASTDNTEAILDRLAKQYATIKVLQMPSRTKPQRRTGIALNMALRHVKNDFVAWMDADDLSLSNRFEKQYNWLIQHPNYAGCGSQVVWKDHRWYVPNRYSQIPTSHLQLLTYSVRQTPIFQQTAFFRSDFLRNTQLQYDETIAYAEDFDFFSRAIRYGHIANLPDKLVVYHLHPAQSIQDKTPHLQSVENTIRKNLTYFTSQAPSEWLQYLNHRSCNSWHELKQCIDMASQTKCAFIQSLQVELTHIDELWEYSLQQKVIAAVHRNPEWLPKLKEEYPKRYAQLGWAMRTKIGIKKLLQLI
jgi:glycosyltransferase involved in cell wall biosynthesis